MVIFNCQFRKTAVISAVLPPRRGTLI